MMVKRRFFSDVYHTNDYSKAEKHYETVTTPRNFTITLESHDGTQDNPTILKQRRSV